MSLLLNYINKYDNWQELLSQAPYYIKVTNDGDYYILKYDQHKSDFNSAIVRECRGCIVKYDTSNQIWDFVCFAMSKFSNVGESYCPEIQWSTASVQEKVDGSLIKFWYDGEWQCSTNGTIHADTCLTGNALYPTYFDLVKVAITQYFSSLDNFYAKLDKNCTYWFELVSPYTQIVVKYDKIDMYFLGWRCLDDMQEIDAMDCILARMMPIPHRYPLNSLAQVRAAAYKLPENNEGYVVCDGQFNRVKIKSPWYIERHYLVNNHVITDERLINVILQGEQDEFLAYCGEYTDRLNYIDSCMYNAHIDALNALEDVNMEWTADKYDHDKKGFAAAAKKVVADRYLPFVFKWYDYWLKDVSFGWHEYVADWSAAKWKKFLEPWLH